ILIDNLYARALGCCGSQVRMRLLIENDFSRVRSVDAGKDLNQCAFATSILTRETVDFGRKNCEVDAVESPNPTETLAYTQHFDKWRGCFGRGVIAEVG